MATQRKRTKAKPLPIPADEAPVSDDSLDADKPLAAPVSIDEAHVASLHLTVARLEDELNELRITNAQLTTAKMVLSLKVQELLKKIQQLSTRLQEALEK